MAGLEQNVKPMWARLRNKLDLEDDVPLHDTVYLGCNQKNIDPPTQLIEEKSKLWKEVMQLGPSCPTNEGENLTALPTVRGGDP